MHQEVKHVMQEVYSGNDNYVLSIEDCDGFLFVHIDIYKWTPSILKMIRCDFEELKLDAYFNGYDFIFSYTQNVKFAKLVDPSFEYGGEIDEGYTVIFWELEDYYGN